MKRILFLLLCIPVFGSPAHGAIEIYANGHKYDSLQAYTLWERSIAAKASSAPVSLNNQQVDYIRQKAQQLGIKVDFSKVKTFQIGQKDLFDTTRHKLYVLSVENGMVNALRDFYETRDPSRLQTSLTLMPGTPVGRSSSRTLLVGRSITPEQLQEAIEQAVTASIAPKLLISGPGKVRIMALSPDNSEQ